MQQETMRGSLFPLFPLRVKCQNHERVPISPISPILVANVSFHPVKTWTTKIGEIGTLSVFSPWWGAKTMRGSLFPLFPLFWWSANVPWNPVKTWTTKIGEIGALSVFSIGEMPKPWEGPSCPLFPLRVKCQNHERVDFPYFPYFQWPISLFILPRHGPPK